MSFIELLLQKGLISHHRPIITPLAGGVSCETFLVQEEGRPAFVAKRALDKLKVQEIWHADISRNLYEQRYLTYVCTHFPSFVPTVLAAYPDDNLLILEYLDGDYKDWKHQLMHKKFNSSIAKNLGTMLAKIHNLSWHDQIVRKQFDSQQNFYQLRLSPYFVHLKGKHPDLTKTIDNLCAELLDKQECLIHGDFSPKNILVSGDHVKIIDCEVAYFGCSLFDVAFMLSHLLIKYVHLHAFECINLADDFLEHYQNNFSHQLNEEKLSCLLAFLILARIDGKSPASYLNADSTGRLSSNALTIIRQERFSIHMIKEVIT